VSDGGGSGFFGAICDTGVFWSSAGLVLHQVRPLQRAPFLMLTQWHQDTKNVFLPGARV
jgi:hypothetical protein